MDEESQSQVLDPRASPEVSIALSMIPWNLDDEKALYLGYRASGLSIRETCRMIGRSKQWLSWCRNDPKFKELEGRIPEYRRDLAKEYIELEFFRNFRLTLEKDYRILLKSLHEPVLMTKADTDYLLKMRSQYSPQQIQILEAIVKGDGSGMDFAKWVAENQEIIKMTRTDSITFAKKQVDDGSES